MSAIIIVILLCLHGIAIAIEVDSEFSVPSCKNAAQNEHLIPDHCKIRKPKSKGNCETLRRWFLHETRGCKAYGICHHQTAELDSETHGINYFTSKEDCQRSCMQGELQLQRIVLAVLLTVTL